MGAAGIQVLWPLEDYAALPHEAVLARLAKFPGKCNVCGARVLFQVHGSNWREQITCRSCGSSPRHRTLAAVVLDRFGGGALGKLQSISIFNTEAQGALHRSLSANALIAHMSSEFVDPTLASGSVTTNGIRHEDLHSLSFPDRSFDVVLTSDVLEHVPDPYRCFAEIERVLKPGGMHVFTVPFLITDFLDDVRAEVGANGNLVHHREALYHDDPVRPETGALVFRLFSLEMLITLEKLGLRTKMSRIRSPKLGILGGNNLVFTQMKAAA